MHKGMHKEMHEKRGAYVYGTPTRIEKAKAKPKKKRMKKPHAR